MRRALAGAAAFLPPSIAGEAPVAVDPPAVLRRRRAVVAGTSVLGATVLGTSLAARAGSPRFYLLTLATAGTWVTGGLASGPLHLGRIHGGGDHLRRPVAAPIAAGLGAFGVFYAGALVVRRIPFLHRAIGGVLDFAEQGNRPLVLLTAYANAVGEEVFFRGAVYAALPPRRAALVSTAVYGAATGFTRNPALVLASGLMGGLFALQRRATGGIQAPMITHLTWSTLMASLLPPLFRDEP